MTRKSCCSDKDVKKGAWTKEEDTILKKYINDNGQGKWRSIPKRAGLKRCGKSCRLRWLNYLRPDIKRGNITMEEEDLIIRLHKLLGNKWSLIAGRLPGRTDNEIKNYWNTCLRKKLVQQKQFIGDNSTNSTSKKCIDNIELQSKNTSEMNSSKSLLLAPQEENIWNWILSMDDIHHVSSAQFSELSFVLGDHDTNIYA